MRDRRKHERLPVFGGHVAITQVAGPNARRCPSAQVRVVDWSRGGLLLRIPSPRRRLLFFKQDPCLGGDDSIYCTLHFPPTYKAMEVLVDVVRVARDPADPDHLHVGVRFEGLETRLEAEMIRLLEPRQRTPYSGRASKVSQRLASPSARTRKAAGSSSREKAPASGRTRTAGSSQRERARSGTSQRVRAQAKTQRIKSHGGTWGETPPGTRLAAQSQRLRSEGQRSTSRRIAREPGDGRESRRQRGPA